MITKNENRIVRVKQEALCSWIDLIADEYDLTWQEVFEAIISNIDTATLNKAVMLSINSFKRSNHD